VWAWAVLKKRWGHGRATWPRIPADVRECASWSTVGAGKAELTGGSHSAVRERERANAGGKRLDVWRIGPSRQRGKRGARAEATSADCLAPPGRERGKSERAGKETSSDRWSYFG
jgi:hypothetical protein